MRQNTFNPITRARLHVVFALVVCIGLVATGVQAQTGVLQGTVTDIDTGMPIEGAFVVAFGGFQGIASPERGGGHGMRHAITGEDGGYAIDGIPVGDYIVKCGARGFVVAHTEASIAEGETTVVNFALEPRTYGTVTGMVNDATTGEPIAGAHVRLIPSMGGGIETLGAGEGGHGLGLHAVTGDDGTYFMENVPAGDYQARAASFGYFPSEGIPVAVADDETAEVNFELEPLEFGSLEGTVTDAITGEPVAGAMVRVFPQAPAGEGLGHGGGMHRTMTDENGYYRFDELIAGPVSVVARAAGFAPADGVAEIVADATATLDLALEPLAFGSIEGVVTDALSGEPIEGVFVFACMNFPGGDGPGGGGWGHAMTDENGYYFLDGVVAGSCHVRAFAWGYYPGETEVEVPVDDTVVADITLEPFDGGIKAAK